MMHRGSSKNGYSLPSFEPYLQLNWFQGRLMK